MQTSTFQEKRKSQRVPVELQVVSEFDNRCIEMCTDNISLDGMFLFSQEFIRPQAIFSARVWIPEAAAPLQVYLTSCFVERTLLGYGIGVQISGISTADRSLWESFYRRCALNRGAQLRQLVQAERTVRRQHILSIGGALSQLAMQALRQQGLEVSQTASITEAIEILRREPIAAVICDLQRPGLDGRLLCAYVNEERLPTRTVLLTSSASPKEFLQGLQAAATRVIAKPCSNELLVTRIFDVLQQRLPAGRALPTPASDKRSPAMYQGSEYLAAA